MTGADITPAPTYDDVALSYLDAAVITNDATLSSRPGSRRTEGGNWLTGPTIAPISDDALSIRLQALRSTATSLLVALSTLRDSDAAERNGVVDDVQAAADHAWKATRELGILLTRLGERDSDDPDHDPTADDDHDGL